MTNKQSRSQTASVSEETDLNLSIFSKHQFICGVKWATYKTGKAYYETIVTQSMAMKHQNCT